MDIYVQFYAADDDKINAIIASFRENSPFLSEFKKNNKIY